MLIGVRVPASAPHRVKDWMLVFKWCRICTDNLGGGVAGGVQKLKAICRLSQT